MIQCYAQRIMFGSVHQSFLAMLCVMLTVRKE